MVENDYHGSHLVKRKIAKGKGFSFHFATFFWLLLILILGGKSIDIGSDSSIFVPIPIRDLWEVSPYHGRFCSHLQRSIMVLDNVIAAI